MADQNRPGGKTNSIATLRGTPRCGAALFDGRFNPEQDKDAIDPLQASEINALIDIQKLHTRTESARRSNDKCKQSGER